MASFELYLNFNLNLNLKKPMDLVVFDLDGTLLNKRTEISPFTRDTLGLMRQKGIHYTVATGRNLHSAHDIIEGHGFNQPHIYCNGVILWDPQFEKLSINNPLSNTEIDTILAAAKAHNITPFISVVSEQNQHFIYHPPVQHDAEETLVTHYRSRKVATVADIDDMPDNPHITNISFLGLKETVNEVKTDVCKNPQLIAYSGEALEGNGLSWMDIHHSDANKGSAVEHLGKTLGASNIICFGDNDNDLSMFQLANESYAPQNAIDLIKNVASDVIGHHDEDGVAHFLRERFSL